ncbi:two-component system QseEF-associated lipoprotein QseG [Citrobacter rodentium]|uniref:Lipoprotein n=2 Tax=Citrobacter rodentium TaxID=67825 RepID=D2TU09_CITRI|nr:two-component system QseEF-associated lipoprotein QseG [Citrobacter rodentium]KIQ53125.1 membrane protein [Citrobacter rodentium]QBY28994.1 two-component system QseEF-associated lipoprotein QseG [Citrobacter rodentium]UHO29148.1 two-component system QseEF-associated lipoprotein QseG [Citrobacter rodentium NBRC 105723 = DSM 16636]CBG89241.1 putative lipoprotein [Citrobacter rodentium ICC168]HAT8014717.1 two-component system QseEF-associated lipoprotein QseG [Citrobacter rodentium NBRC 105723
MPHVLAHIFQRFFSRRAIAAGISCLALIGCTPHVVRHAVPQEKIPTTQLADYLSVECTDIWRLHGPATDTNPLYWLRAIDCAERLMPVQSRNEARILADDSWQNAFKRGVLLANARITPLERRDNIARLDALSPQIPTQVRPLYQIWRDGQALQLQLSEERQRYSKLQQTSDSELDTLRQQQQHMQAQLELTTRKLENLTDIERRLSSRKPGGSYTPDAIHGDDHPAAPVSPDEEVSP